MTRYHFQRPRRTPKDPRALFLPPPIVHERYQLGPEMGHGGQARVYRAWDTRQGMDVVLKRAHLSTHAEHALYAEAEMLAALRHPAIPTFVASFEEGGFSYLVEALREGTALKHLRHFTLEHVLWIGHHLSEVLAYLHQQGVLHRDLAPGNILLDVQHWSLSLVDFGLARPAMSVTQGSAHEELAAGSPGYVAPEHWEQGVISPTCDIYGMGMVLGCALTDCLPGRATSVASFIELRKHPQAISLEERQLLRLLDRMVLPNPVERPDLSEVQFFFSHLSRQVLGTD